MGTLYRFRDRRPSVDPSAVLFDSAELTGDITVGAGSIIGSGTVSNPNYREVGSSCIAERRGIEMEDGGEPVTPFMAFGDTVRMECTLRDGAPLFGAIEQRVVKA